MAKKKFYAVKVGKTPGIYTDWLDCKAQVDGFPNAKYKGFATEAEANAFLGQSVEHTSEIADEAVAYVDGSYNKATKEYSCGIVFLFNNEIKTYAEKGCVNADMRNVAGEIWAAENAMIMALELGVKSLTIVHDYQGIASWCTGEWKANNKATKAYKAYFDSIKDKITIRFVKVKGHSGNKYNDMADKLAKSVIF